MLPPKLAGDVSSKALWRVPCFNISCYHFLNSRESQDAWAKREKSEVTLAALLSRSTARVGSRNASSFGQWSHTGGVCWNIRGCTRLRGLVDGLVSPTRAVWKSLHDRATV